MTRSSPSSSFTSGSAGAPTAAAASPGAMDAGAAAAMVALCGLWGLQQVSLKAVADQASPMLMVALRSLIALLLLAALMRWRGEAPQRARWKAGAVVGALFGLEFLLVTTALGLTQASHVVVFLYTAPVFAALGLQARVPSERLHGVQWCGIALAFGGIALAFLGGMGGPAGAGHTPAWQARAGDALALAAGAAWGATTVVLRGSALAQAPATETLLYQLLGAFVLLLPAAALGGGLRFAATAEVAGHLVFQGVVVSFASFLVWFRLLRRCRASELGAYAFLTPLFGVLLGVWLLGEAMRPAFVIGGVAVLAGIALVGGHDAVARRLARRLTVCRSHKPPAPHVDRRAHQ